MMNKLELAGHESDPVQRGNWLAQHRPLRLRSPLCRWVQRQIEMLAPDQIFIPDLGALTWL